MSQYALVDGCVVKPVKAWLLNKCVAGLFFCVADLFCVCSSKDVVDPAGYVAVEHFRRDVAQGTKSSAGYSFEDVVVAALNGTCAGKTVGDAVARLAAPELAAKLDTAFAAIRLVPVTAVTPAQYGQAGEAKDDGERELRFVREQPASLLLKPSFQMRPGVCVRACGACAAPHNAPTPTTQTA